MIIIENEELPTKEFEDLLSQTRLSLLSSIENHPNPQSIKGTIFETMVYEAMKIEAKGTRFEDKIVQTGLLTFPDILADNQLGVEVKVTEKDKWSSTGNSVLETTRVRSVERVYMLFGKMGGAPDIKFRLYQDCLKEIVVTHSPRYLIDMNLSSNESIFSKMSVEYDTFRLNDPIGHAQNYYKSILKDGEAMWWISSDDDSGQNSSSIVIKSFNSLPGHEKRSFMIESYICFPEILSGSARDKFTRVSAHLINHYNAVSPALRDMYSAGGRVQITINNKGFQISRVVYNLLENLPEIKDYIETIDEELLEQSWGAPIEADRYSQWVRIIEEKSSIGDEIGPVKDFLKLAKAGGYGSQA